METILSYGTLCMLLSISGVENSCQFPNFLQYTDISEQIKPWKTEIWWINLKHNIKWLRKQDIFIEGNNLWRHRENSMKRCDRINRSLNSKSSFGRCSERELVHNRTCLSNEGYNTFKVIQYNPDRSHKFTCMKFIRRSENCVQIAEGPLSDTNDPDLCDESGLVLDEWPWIAPWRQKSYTCPISGGFSFRTISRLTNEDHCENEWRRSSLEVECIFGDGLKFMSPVNSNCNPLLRRGHLKKLICWSGWTTHRYIFMIAGDEAASHPRYCLRFPKDMKGDFSVLIYFSVICPEEEDGKPPTGIQYYELRMKRKDHGRCEDDDEQQCKIIAAQGSCTKDRHKHYADHCRRTCNLCLNRNIARQGCYFDTKLHGNWKLYEKDRQEDVKIERKQVTFSKFGKFFCRESGTNSNQYKSVTTFSNGCVPRYTCFEFSRNNNNLLRYRISRSSRQDKEMEELCSFHEDSYPLLDTYRSFYFKNLILSEIKDLWPSYCGIDSTLPFNGTFNDELCDGTISDWDEDTCTTKGTVTLKSKTCPSLLVPLELQCLAYVKDKMLDFHQMLLTRSMDGKNTFNCWVISSYIIGGKWPWRVMYKMPTTQCTPLSDAEVATYNNHEAKLYLDDKEKTKQCKPVTHHSTMVYQSKETELSHIENNEGSRAPEKSSKSNTFHSENQNDDFVSSESNTHNACCTLVIIVNLSIYLMYVFFGN